MPVNLNADEYATARLGMFFPGYPSSLTGQCVSLVKWFLQEMTTVPNPQGARGHAKDYGDQLVREGHATQVNIGKRGDIVVWKQDGGGYGHIGILCSGNNVFEENVGLQGAASKRIPDGAGGYSVVYASRLDPLFANFRKGSPTFYRVHSYVENVKKEDTVSPEDRNFAIRGRLLASMKPLNEGTIIFEATIPKAEVWKLETAPNYKSGFTYTKGQRFEAIAYINHNNSTYYVSWVDALHGNPWGVNKRDVKLIGAKK